MEQKQFVLCYINPNYCYEQYQQQYALQMAIPTGAAMTEQNRKQKKSLVAMKWPIPVIILSILVIGALAAGIYCILRTSTSTSRTDSTSTTESTPTTLFWPYGIEAGDTSESTSFTYTPDAAVTKGYNIQGEAAGGPSTVILECAQGGTLVEGISLADSSWSLHMSISRPAMTGYDPPDPSQERYCYHRMTDSTADKDRLCALIAGFSTIEPYEAYVFTWVNYTYGGGTQIGTFQMILVFSDAKTYLIRIYDDRMQDIIGVSLQFSVSHFGPDLLFETATMAADVRGKREVFDLTGLSTEPNLDEAAPGDGNSCN